MNEQGVLAVRRRATWWPEGSCITRHSTGVDAPAPRGAARPASGGPGLRASPGGVGVTLARIAVGGTNWQSVFREPPAGVRSSRPSVSERSGTTDKCQK